MASKTLFTSQVSKGIAGVAVAGLGAGVYYRYMMGVAQADSGAPPKAFGSAPAFLSLKLESSEAVNHNTKKLRFQLPQPDVVSGLNLTSALLTFSWPKGCKLPCLRPYTPISHADEPGILEFLVKHYPNGKQSTHIHSLQPGDSLRFVVAIPGYRWTRNKHSAITLIAGGAGITPAYQLIQGILRDPEDRTRVTLVFGVNTDADLLLRDELDAYERRFPDRFRAVYAVGDTATSPGPRLRSGRVTKELLGEVATPPRVEDAMVFVCGPPAMEEALAGKKGILQELGYRKDQIHRF